ncbi:MAG: guanylate kinase [Acidobacteriota bacterium]
MSKSQDERRKGCVFVFSGPSGTGKTTLAWEVVRNVRETEFSISYTTRPPREGEQEAIDYRFVSRAEFERRRQRGEFVEWAEVFGGRYGTRRADLERVIRAGRDIVLDIDVQGALQVRRAFAQAVLVFILPPDFESLRRRLTSRGTDRPEVISRRLAEACSEVREALEFDYLVVNESLEDAAARLRAIVQAERQRRFRQEAVLQQVLKSFPRSRPARRARRAG